MNIELLAWYFVYRSLLVPYVKLFSADCTQLLLTLYHWGINTTVHQNSRPPVPFGLHVFLHIINSSRVKSR